MRLSVACLILAGSSFAAALPQESSSFDSFLSRYRAASATERRELAEAFLRERREGGGLPFVEPGGVVVFVYLSEGDAVVETVRVVGDFRTRGFHSIDWEESGEAMSRAAEPGPLFFKRMRFEPDARLEYNFVVDGRFIDDPLNPRSVPSGVAPAEPGEKVATASELRMPGYRDTVDLTSEPASRGRLETLELAGPGPAATLYLPPGYSSERAYPVVYTTDGKAWRDYIRLPAILDRLIAAERIEPVIAVMIDVPRDRSSWHLFSPEYLKNLERVVRAVDRGYATRPRPEERLHVGTSSGGRASLQVGLEAPELVLNIGMLSPSLTGPPHYYEPYFSGRRRPSPDLKVWLSAGSYEVYIHRDTQMMAEFFERLGVEIQTRYTHEGHSLGTWRNAVTPMMIYFFGARAEGKPVVSNRLGAAQVRPGTGLSNRPTAAGATARRRKRKRRNHRADRAPRVSWRGLSPRSRGPECFGSRQG